MSFRGVPFASRECRAPRLGSVLPRSPGGEGREVAKLRVAPAGRDEMIATNRPNGGVVAALYVGTCCPAASFVEQSFAVPKAAGVHRHRRGPPRKRKPTVDDLCDATMRKRQQQASEQPGDRERIDHQARTWPAARLSKLAG
jgi:hypothetical protein